MKKSIIIFFICMVAISVIAVLKNYVINMNNSCIFILALLLALCVNLSFVIKKLIISFEMLRKMNTGKLGSSRGTIFKVYGHDVHCADTTKKAYANYSFRGKSYSGKMICTYDRKINNGNSYTIYVTEKYPYYFAMSKVHIKNAFLTFLVFFIILIVSIILCTSIIILYFVSEFSK